MYMRNFEFLILNFEFLCISLQPNLDVEGFGLLATTKKMLNQQFSYTTVNLPYVNCLNKKKLLKYGFFIYIGVCVGGSSR